MTEKRKSGGVCSTQRATASTYNDPSSYQLFTSPEQFYEIFFNHRIAYVRADDVDVVR